MEEHILNLIIILIVLMGFKYLVSYSFPLSGAGPVHRLKMSDDNIEIPAVIDGVDNIAIAYINSSIIIYPHIFPHITIS